MHGVYILQSGKGRRKCKYIHVDLFCNILAIKFYEQLQKCFIFVGVSTFPFLSPFCWFHVESRELLKNNKSR